MELTPPPHREKSLSFKFFLSLPLITNLVIYFLKKGKGCIFCMIFTKPLLSVQVSARVTLTWQRINDDHTVTKLCDVPTFINPNKKIPRKIISRRLPSSRSGLRLDLTWLEGEAGAETGGLWSGFSKKYLNKCSQLSSLLFICVCRNLLK